MSRDNRMYVQCVLARQAQRTTGWIPETFAAIGRTVRLKDEGVWEDGWRVVSAGVRLPEDYLRERSQDYRQTRKASDI